MEFTYILQLKWKDKHRKNEKKMLTLLPSGHSDVDGVTSLEHELVSVPRLEGLSADGAGSMWQAVCLHSEPGGPVALCRAPHLQKQVGEIKSLELTYTQKCLSNR